jgi:excinuclease ABC subunit C
VLASEVIDRIPTEPGVYLFKDARGTVIYVGKAKSLKTRVRQYFRDGGDERFFVAAGFLGRAVADVETIVVTSSKEALLLENHLIKKHQPRFNVKLRDDKQYLVLRLVDPEATPGEDTPKRDLFPRVEVVRNIRDDGASYFGPYHSATSARETLRILNRHFQLRTCTDHVLETRGRPCLQYQIKRCSGPCAIDVPPEIYAEQVEDVKMFLGGKNAELVQRLRTRMTTRAEGEDFETAAVLRDSLAAVERTLAKQHIVQDDFVDQDVWGLFREADCVEVVVMFIRAGKLVGRRAFQQKDQELPDSAVITEYLQQYYATGTFIPDEVVVGVELEDSDVLADWLGTARGKKVRIIEPRRGVRAKLVELADRNAAASASSRKSKHADAQELLAKVAKRLALPRPPRRIECFDIAHIQGTDTVAAMVTFIDGVPARGLYRKFKVRSVENDDFAAMYEVLTRRFRRWGGALPAAPASAPGDDTEDPAWMRPDLLVIDGGKGQLGMAVAALADLGVPLGGEQGVEVIGLAKERELEAGSAPDRIYRRNIKDSIALRPNSPELYVLARIRDEAHRFANTFHQHRRGKQTLRSELDSIVGIGATRRQRLLKHFGSVRAVRQASVDELAKAPGMNRKAADAVVAYFAERAVVEAETAITVAEYPNAATISGEISAGEVLADSLDAGADADDDLTVPSPESDVDANVEGRTGDLDVDAEIDEPIELADEATTG